MDSLTRIWAWLKTHFVKIVHTASELVVIVGLPFAAYQLVATRREAQTHALEAHEQVYSVLDGQYMDFLKLCLENPDLDCFDIPDDAPVQLDKPAQARQRILYAVLVPMLEHAYLAYHHEPALNIIHLTETQWPGWRLYASNFMKRASFRAVWKQLRGEFDADFQACMNSLDPTTTPLQPEACDPWPHFPADPP